MRYRAFFLPIILFFCILSSCITPKDTNLLQDIRKDYPQDNAPVDYKIIPGDQLRLTIYTLDDNMKSLFAMFMITNNNTGQNANTNVDISTNNNVLNVLNVYSDGTINIPYVGRVYVQDMTVLEAKKIIGERLSNFSPNVTVDVMLNNRFFSVLGSAGAKKINMSSPRLNIFQALALSGRINPSGDRTKVKIIRQTVGGTEVKTFDLRSKDIVDSEFYYIQPNDVIYMQERQRKFFGEVNSFLGIFGLVTSFIGMATVIVRLVK